MDAIELYQQLKDIGKRDLGSDATLEMLRDLYCFSADYLVDKERQELSSSVPGKSYFAFAKRGKLSRPVNRALYLSDQKPVLAWIDQLGQEDYGLDAQKATAICYTIAISFCSLIDLERVSDQKTPGTFFEYFIGHLLSRCFHVNPARRIEILNLDESATLPTDFVFDLGPKKPKFHVPVKTSTRERVIQVWAHQRVLDGVYGTGRFLGLLVCLAETKLNKRTLDVVEICLPRQWQVYQLFIAQLRRVYYLDLPSKYSGLNSEFPRIAVRAFGEFFPECNSLIEEP